MARSRSLPSLDRAQPGRPAPQAGTALRDAERTLPSALQVPIEQLVPDPDQPRRAMDRNRLTELAGSLTEYGVLQPLLVRADGFLDDGRTRYMIIAGGRRYAAAQQAGLTHLPVVVRYLLKKRGPGRQGRRGGVAGGRLKHDAEGLPWN